MEYLTKDDDLVEKSKTLSQIKEKEDSLRKQVENARLQAEEILAKARDDANVLIDKALMDARAKNKVELQKWMDEAVQKSDDIVHRADEICEELRRGGKRNIPRAVDTVTNEILKS